MLENAQPSIPELDNLPVMLVVGDVSRWSAAGRDLPRLDGVHFVSFSEIDARLVDRLMPDLVVSALVSDTFDAIELARRLVLSGFGGVYRVVAQQLPDVAVVRAEVAAAVPNLDFDVYFVSSASDA